MRALLQVPCTLVAGVKEAGAATFLACLLDEAHPGVVAHVFAHRSAAQMLDRLPNVVLVSDDVDLIGESLLAARQPDLVLVGASTGWSIEKSLTIAAKSVGVPIYAFIDNYMNTWQRFAHEVTAKRWVYLPDRIYAISPEMVKKLRSEGCPSNAIALTTHPVLDRMATLVQPFSETAFRADCQIEEAEVLLTLAVETGMPNSELWCWDNLAEEVDPAIELLLVTLLDFALESQGHVVVLIKQHPSDRKSFEKILTNYPTSIYRTIFNADRLALLDVSTAVFGIGSMLLSEASARNRRTYSFSPNVNCAYPYASSGQRIEKLTSVEAIWLVLRKLGANDELKAVVR